MEVVSEGINKRECVECEPVGKGKLKSRTFHQIKVNGVWRNSKDVTPFSASAKSGGKTFR